MFADIIFLREQKTSTMRLVNEQGNKQTNTVHEVLSSKYENSKPWSFHTLSLSVSYGHQERSSEGEHPQMISTFNLFNLL